MVPQRSSNVSLHHARPRVRSSVITLILGFFLAGAAGTGFGQPPAPPGESPSAESLTRTLVALNVQYQLAGPHRGAQLLNDLLGVAVSPRVQV